MLHYKEAGESRSIKTDAVLLCVGWIGNTDGIGLEELGVEIARSYIKVDKSRQEQETLAAQQN